MSEKELPLQSSSLPAVDYAQTFRDWARTVASLAIQKRYPKATIPPYEQGFAGDVLGGSIDELAPDQTFQVAVYYRQFDVPAHGKFVLRQRSRLIPRLSAVCMVTFRILSQKTATLPTAASVESVTIEPKVVVPDRRDLTAIARLMTSKTYWAMVGSDSSSCVLSDKPIVEKKLADVRTRGIPASQVAN